MWYFLMLVQQKKTNRKDISAGFCIQPESPEIKLVN